MAQSSNYQLVPERPGAGMALASMICGIISIVIFCVWPISIPLAIVAIVLGIIANVQVKASSGSGRGKAMVGIILGIATICLLVGVYFLAKFGVMKLGDWVQQKQQQQIQQQHNFTAQPTTSELFHHGLQAAFCFGRALLQR